MDEELKLLREKANCNYEGNTTDEILEQVEGDFEVVEEGEWCQDHKYQQCTDIIRSESTGKHYAVCMSRSGSYHTDWYYGETEVSHVVKNVQLVEQVSWVVPS